MGGSIAAMHSAALTAIIAPAVISYPWQLHAASLVFGILVCALALLVGFRERFHAGFTIRKLFTAFILGCGIHLLRPSPTFPAANACWRQPALGFAPNDNYGHEAGDAVLRETASWLIRSVRAEDFVCRYGGEEFVAVLPTADLRAAEARAQRIRAKFRNLVVMHQGRSLGVITASIGVAALPDHRMKGRALLQAADAALYWAKREGRDRVIVAEMVPAEKAETGVIGNPRHKEVKQNAQPLSWALRVNANAISCCDACFSGRWRSHHL